MELQDFNQLIVNANNESKRKEILNKYIFHGLPFVFQDKELDYFEFRNAIAKKFKVRFYEVFIVGSAKLGFSYHKQTEFSFDSDIDIVIVNRVLFERYYKKICKYQYRLDQNRKIPSQRELLEYSKFLQYLVKGWMRPDKLPTSFQVDALKSDWFDFFKSISHGKSSVGNYKVSAGLFKNFRYLEQYYLKGFEDLHNSLLIDQNV